jgi:hypothetical protein
LFMWFSPSRKCLSKRFKVNRASSVTLWFLFSPGLRVDRSFRFWMKFLHSKHDLRYSTVFFSEQFPCLHSSRVVEGTHQRQITSGLGMATGTRNPMGFCSIRVWA